MAKKQPEQEVVEFVGDVASPPLTEAEIAADKQAKREARGQIVGD